MKEKSSVIKKKKKKKKKKAGSRDDSLRIWKAGDSVTKYEEISGISSVLRLQAQQKRKLLWWNTENLVERQARMQRWGIIAKICRWFKKKQKQNRELPRWSSDQEYTCQCRAHRSCPWLGKIPHAAEQLSLCATTTEPACCSYWSPHT